MSEHEEVRVKFTKLPRNRRYQEMFLVNVSEIVCIEARNRSTTKIYTHDGNGWECGLPYHVLRQNLTDILQETLIDIVEVSMRRRVAIPLRRIMKCSIEMAPLKGEDTLKLYPFTKIVLSNKKVYSIDVTFDDFCDLVSCGTPIPESPLSTIQPRMVEPVIRRENCCCNCTEYTIEIPPKERCRCPCHYEDRKEQVMKKASNRFRLKKESDSMSRQKVSGKK